MARAAAVGGVVTALVGFSAETIRPTGRLFDWVPINLFAVAVVGTAAVLPLLRVAGVRPFFSTWSVAVPGTVAVVVYWWVGIESWSLWVGPWPVVIDAVSAGAVFAVAAFTSDTRFASRYRIPVAMVVWAASLWAVMLWQFINGLLHGFT